MRSRDRLRHFQKWLEPDLACFFLDRGGKRSATPLSLLSFAVFATEDSMRRATAAARKKRRRALRFAGAVQNALAQIPLRIPLTKSEMFAKSSGLSARFRYQSRKERLRKVRSHYQLRSTLLPLATFFGCGAFRRDSSTPMDHRDCPQHSVAPPIF